MKSSIKGVSWHKRIEKWQARVTVGGKRKNLGYFENVEDAEKAVLAEISKIPKEVGIKNKFETADDYVIIILNSNIGEMKTFVSKDDFELVSKVTTRWFASKPSRSNKYYVFANIEGKIVPLHKFIIGSTDGVVDHIDGCPLNNLRSNLRVVTTQQNIQNRSGANKNSKTGIRGVSFDKETGRYMSQIMVNRKNIKIGRYSTIEEAEKAVREARKIHMPFSEE